MSTKSPAKVKPQRVAEVGDQRESGEPSRNLYIHPSFRKYQGRGHPWSNPRRRALAYGEAVVLIFNDWDGGPFTPALIEEWANDFNWPVEALVAFIDELKRDGVFDLVHPEKGVRK